MNGSSEIHHGVQVQPPAPPIMSHHQHHHPQPQHQQQHHRPVKSSNQANPNHNRDHVIQDNQNTMVILPTEIQTKS